MLDDMVAGIVYLGTVSLSLDLLCPKKIFTTNYAIFLHVIVLI
jgi:hypothetical protein